MPATAASADGRWSESSAGVDSDHDTRLDGRSLLASDGTAFAFLIEAFGFSRAGVRSGGRGDAGGDKGMAAAGPPSAFVVSVLAAVSAAAAAFA